MEIKRPDTPFSENDPLILPPSLIMDEIKEWDMICLSEPGYSMDCHLKNKPTFIAFIDKSNNKKCYTNVLICVKYAPDILNTKYFEIEPIGPYTFKYDICSIKEYKIIKQISTDDICLICGFVRFNNKEKTIFYSPFIRMKVFYENEKLHNLNGPLFWREIRLGVILRP